VKEKPVSYPILPVKSATASSDEGNGNVASNTIDKNLATRWAALGNGQWVKLDMGAADTIRSLNIAWYRGFERSASFDVQTSLNNSTWKTVYSGNTSGTSVTFEKVKLSAAVARYIKIVCHGTTLHLWNAISEIEVIGLIPKPQFQKLLISHASASADDGNVASNAIDSNLNTRWSALGIGQSLQIMLSNPDTIKEVKIAWYKGDIRTADYFIQVSSNGVSWKTIYTGKTSGKTTLLQVNDVADTALKYLKIVGYGNSINNWNSITELEVWGSMAPRGSELPDSTLEGDSLLTTFAQTQQLSLANTDKLSSNGRLSGGGMQNRLPASTEVVVWPNPNKGLFSIKSDMSIWHGGELTIYNSTGKVLFTRKINQSITSVDFSNKSKGVYFIKLKNGLNEVNSKIITQ
jgi:hypothetical protein